MAYQVKRAESEVVELELLGAEGSVEKRLSIRLSLASSTEQVMAKYLELLKLQKSLPQFDDAEDKGAALKALEEAVRQIYTVSIGEENTRELLAFYEGSYMEMARQTLPFLQDEVIPRLQSYAREARKNAVERYGRKRRGFLARQR